MEQRKSPLWMRIHVAEFLSRTTDLTCEQFGAFMRLMLTMFLHDGSLPSDDAKLSRIVQAPPSRWAKVWAAIKPLFTLQGDTITSELVQVELANAHAKIAQAKLAGRSGGRTTQERNHYGRMGNPFHGFTKARPKPLKNNDGPQADAQANYNYNNKKQKEGEPSPLPCNSRASGSLVGNQEKVVSWQPPSKISEPPESLPLSEEERARRIHELEQLRRKVNEKP
jgi:uncharacterized protein YdaU (DUF1376 family)